MYEKGKVDYDEYSYKGYIWHETGRENLQEKRRFVREKPVKPKKKRRAKGHVIKMDKEGAFVAITVLLCFVITFVLAETLGGDASLGIFKNNAKPIAVYYAVAVDSFDDESLAAISADELRQLGGAGYVIYDKKYYLIASVYNEKTSAETVAARLGGYNASVYEITVDAPALKWCKTADKDTVTEVLSYAETTFIGLYEISVELDCGNISESQAVSRIMLLYDEIEKLTLSLSEITIKADNFNLIRIKAEISAVLAMLNNLKNDKLARYNLASDIRYTYTAVIIGYKNLMGNI